MTTRLRALERLSGTGTVLQHGTAIGTGRYDLMVSQEVINARSFGGDTELEGHLSLRGTLRMEEGDLPWLGSDDGLSLTLADGRSTGFVIKRGAISRDTRYSIAGTGQLA